MTEDADLAVVEALEAEDGVVDLHLLVAACSFSLHAPEPELGWSMAGTRVRAADGRIVEAALELTRGEQQVVIAQAVGEDLEDLVRRSATPLAFAAWRRHGPTATTPDAGAFLAAWRTAPVARSRAKGPWQALSITAEHAPTGLGAVLEAHADVAAACVALVSNDVGAKALLTVAASLVPLLPGDPLVGRLHTDYRRRLAQRWWDAPRVF